MATVVESHIDTSVLDGLRISWGGIWGGVLVVMGTLLLLSTLGLAIGISAADPTNTDAGALGTGAAIWTGLSLLIALFLGGFAATRLGLVFDKAAGAFEGALVWVLSFLVILWLASSGVSLVARGVSGVFTGASQVLGSAVGGVDDLAQGDPQQILERLRDPNTARVLAAATGMPEAEVRSNLEQAAQRVEAAGNDPARVASEVRAATQGMMDRARERLPQAAEQVQEGAGKAAWFTFIAMAISLAAAIAGAMVGRRRAVARVAAAEIATTRATVGRPL
jgi:hypothetical protein